MKVQLLDSQHSELTVPDVQPNTVLPQGDAGTATSVAAITAAAIAATAPLIKVNRKVLTYPVHNVDQTPY